jgi:hypothetical protein
MAFVLKGLAASSAKYLASKGLGPLDTLAIGCRWMGGSIQVLA